MRLCVDLVEAHGHQGGSSEQQDVGSRHNGAAWHSGHRLNEGVALLGGAATLTSTVEKTYLNAEKMNYRKYA